MFKTDPRNAGYVCEIGARRSGEAVRDKEVEESDEQRIERLLKKAEERGTGRMMALGTKAGQTKIEIAEADALGAIRARNATLEAYTRCATNPVEKELGEVEQGKEDSGVAEDVWEMVKVEVAHPEVETPVFTRNKRPRKGDLELS